jgi:hypothetical protein
LLGLQVGLEDRFEHQHCRRLRDSILDRRDSQGPLLAVGFGNPNPTDGSVDTSDFSVLPPVRPAIGPARTLDVLELWPSTPSAPPLALQQS